MVHCANWRSGSERILAAAASAMDYAARSCSDRTLVAAVLSFGARSICSICYGATGHGRQLCRGLTYAGLTLCWTYIDDDREWQQKTDTWRLTTKDMTRSVFVRILRVFSFTYSKIVHT